jgi:hypothetical protein
MKRACGFTLIELLILLSILLVIARWVTYGPRISAWERSVVESWGLPNLEIQFFTFAGLFLVLVIVAVRHRLKERRKRQRRLEVPR